MGVDHGRAYINVTQQLLHGADVNAGLEQVCGEGVAQGVESDEPARSTGMFSASSNCSACSAAAPAFDPKAAWIAAMGQTALLRLLRPLYRRTTTGVVCKCGYKPNTYKLLG